jgi:hypothetical protein
MNHTPKGQNPSSKTATVKKNTWKIAMTETCYFGNQKKHGSTNKTDSKNIYGKNRTTVP